MVRTNLHVNKNSHQISKPTAHRTNAKPLHLLPPPPPSPQIDDVEMAGGGGFPTIEGGPNQTQHPPVYNINKDDFRDVVQRLTGSQQRLGPTAPPQPQPPPQPQTRPPSSRLQRIRPPPLSQIANRSPMPQVPSPLPPLPSVHSAAESPISAYLRRCFQPNLPMESPVTAYMRSILQQTQTSSSSAALPPPPPPRVLSPCGMSTAGFGLPPPQQQTPLSPAALPTSSPRWKTM